VGVGLCDQPEHRRVNPMSGFFFYVLDKIDGVYSANIVQSGGRMGQQLSAQTAAREIFALNSDHPWQTVICPIVATAGETVMAIGAGFTVASFGVVLTAGVVPMAALNRSTQIGCVFGAGMESGPHGGVFVPIAQIYTHKYTDFALLQLATPSDGASGSFPILPLTMCLPAAGTKLVVAGYSGFATPGTMKSGNRVIHDWQLSAYWGSVADVTESPRKQGPANKLILFTDDRGFEAGMIGGPVFTVGQSPQNGSYDPVCAVLGQYPRGTHMAAYGMALSPAMGLHVLFPEAGEPTYRCFYDIAKNDQLTSVSRLDRVQLFPFDKHYSVVVELDKTGASAKAPPVPTSERKTPDSWLLSQGLELGYYVAGGVPIIRYTPSLHTTAMPPAMTAAHEKAHMALMTATEYGAFVSELGKVIHRLADLQEQDPSNQIAASFKDLGQAMDQLMKACWLTQESGATAIEILSQLHSSTFDLAAMKQGLPATYVYALEALERIVATLHLPFLPGTEPLRSSLCMGICSAALNTGIIDYLASASKISAATISEYLSNPSARPDARFLKLSEAAQLNPRLLDPVIPALTKTIIDMVDALARATSAQQLGQCYGDAGRNVDRIIQNHIRELGLFSVAPWIDTTTEANINVRNGIRGKIFEDSGLDPKYCLKVQWIDLSPQNLPEKISFSALDHSHDALRAKDLTPFAVWIKRVRNVKVPADGRLVFSAAPIPNPGREDRWTCYLASLTVSPGEVLFNRLAIEFDAVTETDFITALQQLSAPTCVTVYSPLMTSIGDKLKRVFEPLAMPLFQYVPTVSVQQIDGVLAGVSGAQGRLITGAFGPSVFSVCPQDRQQPRLLWFESGDSTGLYRSWFRSRGITLDEGPLDLDREEDMNISLSAWMCTYGTMGATETKQ
jgi:hypothetical protein